MVCDPKLTHARKPSRDGKPASPWSTSAHSFPVPHSVSVASSATPKGTSYRERVKIDRAA
jgi:hypothetical protein